MVYRAYHQNGSGGLRSDWYPCAYTEPRENLDEAIADARQYAEQNPPCNGWNVEVAVLDEDNHVVKQIRPDYESLMQ